jgi:prefoldin subunit 5
MIGHSASRRVPLRITIKNKAPMTTDERIERLTGRHEALAQSVESLTLDVRELTGGIRDLKQIASQSLDSINALARIAAAHQNRISRLEGTGPDEN